MQACRDDRTVNNEHSSTAGKQNPGRIRRRESSGRHARRRKDTVRYTPPKYPVRQHQLYLVKPAVWRRYRRENTIDPEYRKRARRIGYYSRFFNPLKLLQDLFYGGKIAETDLSDAELVFIVGHWRSGTTHLHYLMAEDPSFGYLTNYQALFFNIAHLSTARMKALVKPFFPRRRPQDNVRITPDAPQEEEQPLSTMTARSGLGGFYFPRNDVYFRKYLFFEGCSEAEIAAWEEDYRELLQSISLLNGKKDLVLKNPHNTGRIAVLSRMFPQAKFIFIHRNPYDIYQSTLHLYDSIVKTQFLQHISPEQLQEKIVSCFRQMFRAYESGRSHLREDQLIEISYSSLSQRPLETAQQIYRRLSLPGFDAARPRMEQYLSRIGVYRPNAYEPLSDETLDILNREWAPYFQRFGYEML
jgi:omega-hydroxy-beta-dihydromenaquinone-9 sulfotransferase